MPAKPNPQIEFDVIQTRTIRIRMNALKKQFPELVRQATYEDTRGGSQDFDQDWFLLLVSDALTGIHQMGDDRNTTTRLEMW